MTYLIQGFFFQECGNLGIGFDHSGVVAVLIKGISPFMFAGVLASKDKKGNVLSGCMTDQVGQSRLTKVVLTETHLSFMKQYEKQDYQIEYRFEKQSDGTWKGTWRGKECGVGFANCSLTKVPDDFFCPVEAFSTSCSDCGGLLENDPGDYQRVR